MTSAHDGKYKNVSMWLAGNSKRITLANINAIKENTTLQSFTLHAVGRVAYETSLVIHVFKLGVTYSQETAAQALTLAIVVPRGVASQ